MAPGLPQEAAWSWSLERFPPASHPLCVSVPAVILVSVRVRDSVVPPGFKEESSFLICVPAPSGGQQGPAGTNNAPPTPLHLTQKTHAAESCRLHQLHRAGFTIGQWFNVPRQQPPRSVLQRLEYRLKSRWMNNMSIFSKGNQIVQTMRVRLRLKSSSLT